MIFTNNIVALMIISFFIIYFTIFNEKIFKFNAKFKKARVYYIAIYSAIFYATWYLPAILLLIYYSILTNYSKILSLTRESKSELTIFIILALFPLFFFKYFNFFIDLFNINSSISFILPLGISFYAFSIIGYFIDIYKQKTKPFDNFLECLLFVSFWPHLASGPILRAKNIYDNINKKEVLNLATFTLAIVLICSGLVKKLLIADNIGAYVNWNFSYGVESMNIFEAWASILGFGMQIYADFSGYSDMAIGFALLMGFRLPANFNYPYLATSVTEFWHRWHISLSTWFRDYLYFPLGGSRKGKIKTYINIFIVFLVSGIWHGATINFAIWGMIHGLILILEKIFYKSYIRVYKPLRWVITFTLVMIAWAYFRLDVNEANLLVSKMFDFNKVEFNSTSPYYVAVIVLMLIFPLLEHLFKFYKVDEKGQIILNNKTISIVVLTVLLFIAFNFSGSPLPFIYFEF